MDSSAKRKRETHVATTIALRNGDVRALQVNVADGKIVIAVFDEAGDSRPLIQATLDQGEQASLVHALLGPGTGNTTSDGGGVPQRSAIPAGSCRRPGRA